MPAPLGNQNALGNKGGRPIERDRSQLAKELIEWAMKPDSINFNKFCCTRNPPLSPSRVIQYANECVEFKEAYEIAKSYLASRREEWVSSEMLHVKAYDKNDTVYDLFLKDEKRQQAEFEASLKAQEQKTATEAEEKRFEAYMSQLEKLQSK